MGYDNGTTSTTQKTFAPVVKKTTIWLIFSIVITNNWSLCQLDVSNTFLHGILEDKVYMRQPPNYRDKERPYFVCRLLKLIYGLKQSPRVWFHR